jgi:hypothetical protein
VAELLLEPAEDVDELAVRVIERLDALRAERPFYVVLTQALGQPAVTWGHGAFSTANQAQKAVEKGTVPVLGGSKVGVVQVHPIPQPGPEKPGRCAGCGHPAATHNFPKSKVKGCVVGLPVTAKDGRTVQAVPRCECEELT